MISIPTILTDIRERIAGGNDEAADPDMTATTGSDTDHAAAISPGSIHLESNTSRAGEKWCKTLFISDWPDTARPGMLDMLTTYPSSEVDISIHASPRKQSRAVAEFEGAVRDLTSELKTKRKSGDPSADTTERRLNEHKELLSQISSGTQQVFDVSLYITIRATTKDRVEKVSRRIKNELQKTQLHATSVDYREEAGLTSASPVAKDLLSREIPNVTTPMLGRAAGALFPFSATTILEESGILLGYHASTDEPVVVDRYARPNGYNILTAGVIGAGKSFGTKLHLLRHLAKDPDTILVMLDPLEGFKDLADALNAETITVGGQRGLNPLELNETPGHVLRENPQLDPYGQAFNGAMGFFSDFFTHISDAGEGLSKIERSVLSEALRTAYRERGITDDPDTHYNDSPVVMDVDAILARIEEDAGAFLADVDSADAPDPSSRYVEKWEDAAADLRISMRPFHSGEFRNLAGESDIDIRGSKVTYLDLQQGEGQREIGLMMQLLLDAVYERAKSTEKKVIFCIDEAHYLMQNEASLDWLERLTRHSRHNDLSLHLVTQEASDFLIHEKAETIANNCSQKILHRLPGLTPENAEALGLSTREAEFVRQAKPGTRERGYSHALVAVDDAVTVPIRVAALNAEARIIDPPEDESEERGVSL